MAQPMTRRILKRVVFAAALVLPATAAHPEEHEHTAALPADLSAEFLPATSPAATVTDRVVPLAPTESAPEPIRTTTPLDGGVASYYGSRFHGRPTASGERFDMHAFTAAHRTLPFGSLVEVTNPATGRSVTVRINDRGPFHGSRVIDVSRAAADELGLVQRGKGRVELALVTED